MQQVGSIVHRRGSHYFVSNNNKARKVVLYKVNHNKAKKRTLRLARKNRGATIYVQDVKATDGPMCWGERLSLVSSKNVFALDQYGKIQPRKTVDVGHGMQQRIGREVVLGFELVDKSKPGQVVLKRWHDARDNPRPPAITIDIK
jgi:hypothetical protein